MELSQRLCKLETCDNPVVGNDNRKRYCSLKCAVIANNGQRKKPARYCPICGQILIEAIAQACSRKCSDERIYRDYITRWEVGTEPGGSWHGVSVHVRKWLCRTHGEKCSICGWAEHNPTTGLVPVQVDHIDGNPHNHRPTNLRLLCPNCHSLTITYGSLNLGNGRKERYKENGS